MKMNVKMILAALTVALALPMTASAGDRGHGRGHWNNGGGHHGHHGGWKGNRGHRGWNNHVNFDYRGGYRPDRRTFVYYQSPPPVVYQPQYYQPAPVYYQPAPVYAPRPVYYQPQSALSIGLNFR